MSDNSSLIDSQPGEIPEVESKFLAHDQSKNSGPIGSHLVVDHEGGGIPGSSSLSVALQQLSENESRKYSPTVMFGVLGTWAKEMARREHRLENKVTTLETKAEKSGDELTTLRVENAALRARLIAARQHRPLIELLLAGGPIVVAIGLDHMKSNLGPGLALIALGAVFVIVGLLFNRRGEAE